MAEKKAVGHAYNVDFLNVIFAASGIFLFVSVIWMIWDDYDREWKDSQRRFVQLESEVVRATLEQNARQVDRAKLKALEDRRAAAQKSVEANRTQIEAIQDKINEANVRLYRATQEYQFSKAKYDVDKYDYEVAVNEKSSSTEARGRHVQEVLAKLTELNLEVERITTERDNLQKELGKYTGELSTVDKQIAEMMMEQQRLERRLQAIQPSVRNLIRDAPLLDFMAPTIKVQQVITPNIVDDVNFTRVPKMDRCQTCHLAIDKKGYEKYPQPFTTHPNLALYLGSDSPHPLDRTGCTVCHEGMGQSITFRDASHTPSNEEKKKEWEEKYHWEVPHLWDYPMLPAGMTEASCAKCHKGETFVPGGDRLNTAYGLYERAGCYACHKTRGFENLRKPGPNLTKIQSKLTPDWVKTWIRNPRAIKSNTWMPRPWYNSNSSAPEDAVRNEVEIEATVAYLFANSGTHEFVPSSGSSGSSGSGNTATGKQIVESIGCLGCHVNDDTPRLKAGPRRTFGQPLVNIGNKTTYQWLYDWVRDPAHYSPDTYMPDLRLTDAQVADVATYLAGLKGSAGDSAKATFDQKAVDEVYLDYLKAVMPFEEARATVAKTDATAKRLDLGRRVIARYGCFSCHEIKGFETTQPIGIELSEEGSKLVSRLDFAFVHEIPHTKTAWFEQKVKDPRVFDRGRVLLPDEKLRMPAYDATDEEARLLVSAIMSFQRDVQPAAALRPHNARADALIAGRNLVRRRNCVACHVIEGDGGDYRALVSDPTLAPPLLTPEGAKVQPDWLYAFLRNPITIRPWLAVRMPTFHQSDANWNQIIRYFQAISNSVGPFQTHEVLLTGGAASDLRGTGQELFTLLKCQQCHVLGVIPKDQPTANLAPDLRMSPDRLQPDWILDWLKNPAAIQPGTRMPQFWPEYPKSFYPQFDHDAEKQIRAVRDHLMTLRGGPSPRRPSSASTAPNP